MDKKVQVVNLTGGTGGQAVVKAFKNNHRVQIRSVVTSFDSGGSAKVFVDEMGVLPSSDWERILLAHSQDSLSPLWRIIATTRLQKLDSFKADNPRLHGLNVSNAITAALFQALKNPEEVMQALHTLYDTPLPDSVIPVTFDSSELAAHYSSGRTAIGEHAIDEPENDWQKPPHTITQLFLTLPVRVNPRVITAIDEADIVIMGPGDGATSILPIALVPGVANALRRVSERDAIVALIVNIMNKIITKDWTTSDHLRFFQEYVGEDTINAVVANKNGIQSRLLKKYAVEGSEPVIDDLGSPANICVIREALVSTEVAQQVKGDAMRRSLIRHDPAMIHAIFDPIVEKIFALKNR